MTPEQAREIDRLEFEADCRAARERAFAVIAQRHGAERSRVLRWVERDTPRHNFNPSAPKPQSKPDVMPVVRPSSTRRVPMRGPRSAHGLTMTMTEWAAHLGISLNTLHQRIHKKGSLEGAIAVGSLRRKCQPDQTPGVVKNLPASQGTGGGSLAQDNPQLEFLQ